MSGSTEGLWFLSLGESVEGPMPWAELEERVRKSPVADTACVRSETSPAWKPYRPVRPATSELTPALFAGEDRPSQPPFDFGIVFPLRTWLRDRPWRNRWVRWFTFYALFPVLIGRIITGETTLKDVVWSLGLYFAVISGFVLFFWLRPAAVSMSRLLGVAAFTAVIGGALVLAGQKLPILHQLYAIEESPSFFTRFFGSVLGVGLLEEGAKALPIFWIFVRQRKNASLGEIAFLGAVSGLSFGVMEAVGYSYTYASEHAGRVVEMWERYHTVPQLFYASFVIQETTRLMSLPLLHAIWCAMASLFVAMAALFVGRRSALLAAGWALVATLHGFYDAALSSEDPSPWLAFGVALLSVLLFVEYSRTGASILERLRKEEPELPAPSAP